MIAGTSVDERDFLRKDAVGADLRPVDQGRPRGQALPSLLRNLSVLRIRTSECLWERESFIVIAALSRSIFNFS